MKFEFVKRYLKIIPTYSSNIKTEKKYQKFFINIKI